MFNFDATFKTFDGSLTNQLLADDVIVQDTQAGHDAAGVCTQYWVHIKSLCCS